MVATGGWEEEEFIAKIVREKTSCEEAPHVGWTRPVDFPDQKDHTMMELQRICLREKDPEAWQLMRRKQADLRFKRQQGSERHSETPRLRFWKSWTWTEERGELKRTHRHCSRSLHSALHRHTKKCWHGYGSDGHGMGEVLRPLPVIFGQRTREAALPFRQRTPCSEDHMVIEMLRELVTDIPESWDGGCRFDVVKLLVTKVKKKNGKLTVRRFRPIAMLPTTHRPHAKGAATSGGSSTNTSYSSSAAWWNKPPGRHHFCNGL